MVADIFSRFPYTSVNKYEHITSNYRCHANVLFAICGVENNKDYFLLNLLTVQIEQQNSLRRVNSKLSACILDWVSGYSNQAHDEVEIILYYSKIYVPQTLRIRVLDWYHFYINHPCCSRLSKISR